MPSQKKPPHLLHLHSSHHREAASYPSISIPNHKSSQAQPTHHPWRPAQRSGHPYVPIDQAHLIKKLMDGLEGPLCSFLDQQDPPPDWIIYDLLHHLVPRLVRRFDLPSAYFSVMSGLTHSFLGPPSVLLGPRDQTPFTPELLLEVPPWVPFPTS